MWELEVTTSALSNGNELLECTVHVTDDSSGMKSIWCSNSNRILANVSSRAVNAIGIDDPLWTAGHNIDSSTHATQSVVFGRRAKLTKIKMKTYWNSEFLFDNAILLFLRKENYNDKFWSIYERDYRYAKVRILSECTQYRFCLLLHPSLLTPLNTFSPCFLNWSRHALPFFHCLTNCKLGIKFS